MGFQFPSSVVSWLKQSKRFHFNKRRRWSWSGHCCLLCIITGISIWAHDHLIYLTSCDILGQCGENHILLLPDREVFPWSLFVSDYCVVLQFLSGVFLGCLMTRGFLSVTSVLQFLSDVFLGCLMTRGYLSVTLLSCLMTSRLLSVTIVLSCSFPAMCFLVAWWQEDFCQWLVCYSFSVMCFLVAWWQ